MTQIITDSNSLACSLNILSRQINAAAARLLGPLGITPSQANVLYELSKGETSPSTIARNMGVDASSLSRLLGTLEKKGYLERAIDPDNRTRIALQLTEEGRQLALRADPHAEQIQRRIESALSPRHLQVLRQSILEISAAMRPEGDIPLE